MVYTPTMTSPDTWRLDDDAAAFYDEHFVPAIFARWAPLLAEAASLGPGQHVLDAACGTGAVAREAAERVGASGKVTGLDRSPSMICRARERRPDLEWREGDVTAMPFPDDTFDAVLTQAALMFVPDPAAALREMRRVLKLGGALAAHVFGDSPGYEAIAGVIERVAGPEPAAVFRAPFSMKDPNTLTAFLGEAGFGTFDLSTRNIPARFDSVEHLVRTEIEGWVLKGRVDADALLPGVREVLAPYVQADGSVEVPMEGHIVATAKA